MTSKRRSISEIKERFQEIADRGIAMAHHIEPSEAAKIAEIIDTYEDFYYGEQ